MFWTKRLKEDADTDSSWVLSYGDLMTLLLAVFVMIAAMSELGSGERFRRIAGGVRQAFGFRDAGFAAVAPGARPSRPLTFVERLEQAGFARRSQVYMIGPDDAVLAPCDVELSDEAVKVQIAGGASFAASSAVLQPAAVSALRRIAGFLLEGTSRIEVRGHAAEGPLPAGVPFRDGLDLSYARARAVADILAASGVSRSRLFVTAWDASASPDAPAQQAASRPALPAAEGLDRVIEIVVHASPKAGHE